MLHEGLGSLALWKNFPGEVARVTGHEVMVYSRYGYGNSEPLTEAREVRYMHDEALATLPEFLDTLAIDNPILLGHSDGASIALIHAGAARRPLTALIVLAPHVFVEDLSLSSIAAIKATYDSTDLPTKLGRYHQDVDRTFRGWNDIWLRPDFAAWNIEEYLASIAVPILAVQGLNDEYGTMEQVSRIVRTAPLTKVLELNDCGHSPHRDQAALVLSAIGEFVRLVTR
jgi:pimeloyl-ACP methyl ester carboxylesterase